MKIAVVLFNLGGPDGPEAIRRFRVNLFSDRAIIRAPFFVRLPLARYIAGRSAAAAEKNYAYMGGKSPLLELTRRQGQALEAALGDRFRVFIAMRYWHPFAAETVRAVKEYDPDQVLLLPLYPQFSSTTTGSSVADWHEAAAAGGLVKATSTLCCWFGDEEYLASVTALVEAGAAKAKAEMPGVRLRLLFSAHGLPEVIVARGDPYQAQVEATVAGVVARLRDREVEHLVCYQSRATPQKWLEPSTVDAILQAGRDKVAVLLVPIAFVSDHIETLVELDIENRELAHQAGVPGYFRAAVPNADTAFIAALAGLARRAVREVGVCSFEGRRVCEGRHKDCPNRHAA